MFYQRKTLFSLMLGIVLPFHVLYSSESKCGPTFFRIWRLAEPSTENVLTALRLILPFKTSGRAKIYLRRSGGVTLLKKLHEAGILYRYTSQGVWVSLTALDYKAFERIVHDSSEIKSISIVD